MLVRFALERILCRLTQSKYADHFLLKGALLFTLWFDACLSYSRMDRTASKASCTMWEAAFSMCLNVRALASIVRV